jgi:monofunctional biosynthetic peptidoglycan transglycosylase
MGFRKSVSRKRNVIGGRKGHKRGLSLTIALRVGKVAMLMLLVLVGVILLLRFIDPPTWSWRIQRAINPPTGYPEHVSHQWCDLDEIPTALQLAVVASEDQNFPNHLGVDFDAIIKALNEAGRNRSLRGASTITQQTVKNLFLWEGKDWTRKILEAGISVVIELLWGKRRILEVYLNIAEFGPGVYGVCAGSKHWYRLPVRQLSRNEAARLVALLPSPWRYQAEPPTPYISERARWIEQQMDRMGEAWLQPIE